MRLYRGPRSLYCGRPARTVNQFEPSMPTPHPAFRAPSPALRRVSSAALVVMILGCTAAPEPAPPPEPSPPPPAPDPAVVADLLEAAAAAFEKDRLLTPPDDNAVEYLHRLAELDPTNADAATLRDRIVERHLEAATLDAERGYFHRARAMLDRARIVQPDHPAITQVTEVVETLAQARRIRIPLDRAAVSGHTEQASARLRNIGARAKLPNTRVTIVARSDAEGRWMYQQMRQAPGERRIIAELTIGSPPSVELIELPCEAAEEETC
jgi:hypothetical protein